jgi:hypothetical protein
MNLIRREDPDSIGTPVYGQERTDAYGCKYVYAKAKQACVLNTPYMLMHDENGVEAVTVAAAGTDMKIIVADKAAATGAGVWCAVRGPHDILCPASAAITAGHALIIHTDGTVAGNSAEQTATGVDEFASLIEAKATGTSKTVKCFLFDKVITWT